LLIDSLLTPIVESTYLRYQSYLQLYHCLARSFTSGVALLHEPTYYHGPHELYITPAGPQNQLILS